MINFTIPGVPVAKERPRLGKNAVYTPQKTRLYETKVRYIMRQYMIDNKLSIMDGALIFTLSIEIEPPKSWSQKKKNDALSGKILPTTKPDLDNYKTIFDAANMILYHDDAQIVVINSRKIYAAESRAVVTIKKHP